MRLPSPVKHSRLNDSAEDGSGDKQSQNRGEYTCRVAGINAASWSYIFGSTGVIPKMVPAKALLG
jgi:hypothetical protein